MNKMLSVGREIEELLHDAIQCMRAFASMDASDVTVREIVSISRELEDLTNSARRRAVKFEAMAARHGVTAYGLDDAMSWIASEVMLTTTLKDAMAIPMADHAWDIENMKHVLPHLKRAVATFGKSLGRLAEPAASGKAPKAAKKRSGKKGGR